MVSIILTSEQQCVLARPWPKVVPLLVLTFSTLSTQYSTLQSAINMRNYQLLHQSNQPVTFNHTYNSTIHHLDNPQCKSFKMAAPSLVFTHLDGQVLPIYPKIDKFDEIIARNHEQNVPRCRTTVYPVAPMPGRSH